MLTFVLSVSGGWNGDGGGGRVPGGGGLLFALSPAPRDHGAP